MVGATQQRSTRRPGIVEVFTRKFEQDGCGEVAHNLVVTFAPLLGGRARVHIQDGADQTVGLFALFGRRRVVQTHNQAGNTHIPNS